MNLGFTQNAGFLEQSRNAAGTSYKRHVAFQLARIICRQRGIAQPADLRAFCINPDNLRPWLPSQVDREQLAQEITAFC
jgi:hypothetical protein